MAGKGSNRQEQGWRQLAGRRSPGKSGEERADARPKLHQSASRQAGWTVDSTLLFPALRLALSVSPELLLTFSALRREAARCLSVCSGAIFRSAADVAEQALVSSRSVRARSGGGSCIGLDALRYGLDPDAVAFLRRIAHQSATGAVAREAFDSGAASANTTWVLARGHGASATCQRAIGAAVAEEAGATLVVLDERALVRLLASIVGAGCTTGTRSASPSSGGGGGVGGRSGIREEGSGGGSSRSSTRSGSSCSSGSSGCQGGGLSDGEHFSPTSFAAGSGEAVECVPLPGQGSSPNVSEGDAVSAGVWLRRRACQEYVAECTGFLCRELALHGPVLLLLPDVDVLWRKHPTVLFTLMQCLSQGHAYNTDARHYITVLGMTSASSRLSMVLGGEQQHEVAKRQGGLQAVNVVMVEILRQCGIDVWPLTYLLAGKGITGVCRGVWVLLELSIALACKTLLPHSWLHLPLQLPSQQQQQQQQQQRWRWQGEQQHSQGMQQQWGGGHGQGGLDVYFPLQVDVHPPVPSEWGGERSHVCAATSGWQRAGAWDAWVKAQEEDVEEELMKTNWDALQLVATDLDVSLPLRGAAPPPLHWLLTRRRASVQQCHAVLSWAVASAAHSSHAPSGSTLAQGASRPPVVPHRHHRHLNLCLQHENMRFGAHMVLLAGYDPPLLLPLVQHASAGARAAAMDALAEAYEKLCAAASALQSNVAASEQEEDLSSHAGGMDTDLSLTTAPSFPDTPLESPRLQSAGGASGSAQEGSIASGTLPTCTKHEDVGMESGSSVYGQEEEEAEEEVGLSGSEEVCALAGPLAHAGSEGEAEAELSDDFSDACDLDSDPEPAAAIAGTVAQSDQMSPLSEHGSDDVGISAMSSRRITDMAGNKQVGGEGDGRGGRAGVDEREGDGRGGRAGVDEQEDGRGGRAGVDEREVICEGALSEEVNGKVGGADVIEGGVGSSGRGKDGVAGGCDGRDGGGVWREEEVVAHSGFVAELVAELQRLQEVHLAAEEREAEAREEGERLREGMAMEKRRLERMREEESAGWEAARVQMEGAVRQLQEDLTRLEREKWMAEEEAAAARASIELATCQLQEETRRLGEAMASVASREEELARWREQVESVGQEVRRLRQEKEEAEAALEEARVRYEGERRRLEEELEKEKREKAAAQAEGVHFHFDSQEKVGRLERELRRLREEEAAWGGRMEELVQRLQQAEEQLRLVLGREEEEKWRAVEKEQVIRMLESELVGLREEKKNWERRAKSVKRSLIGGVLRGAAMSAELGEGVDVAAGHNDEGEVSEEVLVSKLEDVWKVLDTARQDALAREGQSRQCMKKADEEVRALMVEVGSLHHAVANLEEEKRGVDGAKQAAEEALERLEHESIALQQGLRERDIRVVQLELERDAAREEVRRVWAELEAAKAAHKEWERRACLVLAKAAEETGTGGGSGHPSPSKDPHSPISRASSSRASSSQTSSERASVRTGRGAGSLVMEDESAISAQLLATSETMEKWAQEVEMLTRAKVQLRQEVAEARKRAEEAEVRAEGVLARAEAAEREREKLREEVKALRAGMEDAGRARRGAVAAMEQMRRQAEERVAEVAREVSAVQEEAARVKGELLKALTAVEEKLHKAREGWEEKERGLMAEVQRLTFVQTVMAEQITELQAGRGSAGGSSVTGSSRMSVDSAGGSYFTEGSPHLAGLRAGGMAGGGRGSPLLKRAASGLGGVMGLGGWLRGQRGAVQRHGLHGNVGGAAGGMALMSAAEGSGQYNVFPIQEVAAEPSIRTQMELEEAPFLDEQYPELRQEQSQRELLQQQQEQQQQQQQQQHQQQQHKQQQQQQQQQQEIIVPHPKKINRKKAAGLLTRSPPPQR